MNIINILSVVVKGINRGLQIVPSVRTFRKYILACHLHTLGYGCYPTLDWGADNQVSSVQLYSGISVE